MKKNQIIALSFLTGLSAGFICGIVPAVRTIIAQEYWKTGMYVLIAEHTTRQLLPWMDVGGEEMRGSWDHSAMFNGFF